MTAAAGCTQSPLSSENGSRSGHAAFFTLWDWAEEVSGETMSFSNPVPVGRVGHGFDPSGDLVREIANTATFVYLDSPEFGWAKDIAGQLRRDYSSIQVIDGLSGFTADQLLAFESPEGTEPDRDHDWDPASVDIEEIDVVDSNTGGVTASWHDAHWDGGVRDISVDGSLRLAVIAEDSAGRVLPIGEDAPFQVDARLGEDAPDEIIEISSADANLTLEGRETGRTSLVIQLVADGDVVWESEGEALSVEVVESLEEVDVDEFYDPHVWVDPILAKEIVETIADGLGEVVPDAAEQFEERASDYKTRLDEVDQQFREMMDEAERSVAVFAGHDAFRYLQHRYGFELHSPRGVTPDHQPSQSEIAETIELIEAEEIDTILYDPFETADPGKAVPPLAQTLVESHERVTDALPITPIEGTTEEWAEADWGWIEQMEQLNLPALRQALGAT